MRNWKNLILSMLAVAGMTMTSCLHIIEEVTVRKDGSGSYSMMIDMSELKSMMDMFKGMGETGETDSLALEENVVVEEAPVVEEVVEAPPVLEEMDTPVVEEAAPAEDNSMSQLGEQLAGNIKESLRGIAGITNVVEVNDTSNLKFGYTFDFANVDALNKAIKVINKEKYDSKAEETFRFKGKKFERLGAANIGQQLMEAMEESGGEDADMGMMKTFFADMSYKQVYNFPDRKVKKNSNKWGEVSADGHSVTVTLKPFDEEQKKQKAGVETVLKLK